MEKYMPFLVSFAKFKYASKVKRKLHFQNLFYSKKFLYYVVLFLHLLIIDKFSLFLFHSVTNEISNFQNKDIFI